MARSSVTAVRAMQARVIFAQQRSRVEPKIRDVMLLPPYVAAAMRCRNPIAIYAFYGAFVHTGKQT